MIKAGGWGTSPCGRAFNSLALPCEDVPFFLFDKNTHYLFIYLSVKFPFNLSSILNLILPPFFFLVVCPKTSYLLLYILAYNNLI